MKTALLSILLTLNRVSNKTDFPQEWKYNMRERNIKDMSCGNPNKLHRNGENRILKNYSVFRIIPHINGSLGTVIVKLSIASERSYKQKE